jgi:hypothetical protein
MKVQLEPAPAADYTPKHLTPGGVVRGIQAFDHVVRVGAIDTFVRLGPQAELEMESARRGLVAGETQRIQVALTLRRG